MQGRQSPEHIQKLAASSFRAVNEAYEVLTDDTKRLLRNRGGSRGPGAASSSAGARAYTNAYGSYGSTSYSGTSYSGYSQYRRRQHFNFQAALRSFAGMGRQEVVLTLGLGVLLLGGGTLLEPVFSSLWERQNQGKLFMDIEQDVLGSQRDELHRLRAARQAREAAAASDAAAPMTRPPPAATHPGADMAVAEGSLSRPAQVAAEGGAGVHVRHTHARVGSAGE
ncbi:hypothetical protein N2152v2_004671 [Parachlorella kessleri]